MSTTAPGPPYDIPGGAAISVVVAAHDVARLTALGRGGNASMLLYAYPRTHERLNVPDTLKAQMSSRITPPMVLMSHLGERADVGDRLVARLARRADRALDRRLRAGAVRRVVLRGRPQLVAAEAPAEGCSTSSGSTTWERATCTPASTGSARCVPADDERGTLTFVPDHAAAGDWVEAARRPGRAHGALERGSTPSTRPSTGRPRRCGSGCRTVHPPEPDDPSALFRDESARSLQLAGGVTP